MKKIVWKGLIYFLLQNNNNKFDLIKGWTKKFYIKTCLVILRDSSSYVVDFGISAHV